MTSLKDCSSLNKIDKTFNFSLCNCNSFYQYFIDLDNKKRLFTVLGETHLTNISEFCKNAYPPYNYIDFIFQLSWQSNKKIKIFLELPFLQKNFRYTSFNINKILTLEENLKKSLEESYKINQNPLTLKMIDFIPKIEKVDPRYLDEKEEFIINLYDNEKLNKITLQNLKIELGSNSFFSRRINPLMSEVFSNIKDTYNKDIFKKISRYYASIKSSFSEIKDFFKLNIEPKIQDDSINMKELLNEEEIIKIIFDLRQFYSKIVDVYVYIQIFDKDSDFDNIIFLVGDAHTENIKRFLSSDLIFEKKNENGIINIDNSYY